MKKLACIVFVATSAFAGYSWNGGGGSGSGTIPGGSGYQVTCADGTISNSGGIQGACSHHGGEAP